MKPPLTTERGHHREIVQRARPERPVKTL